MMTVYGEKSLVIEALKNECSNFIEKPFNLDALFLGIERVKLLKLQNTGPDNPAEPFARLAHQINNHLTVIMGQAELGIVNCNENIILRKRFELIIEAGNQIGDAINKDSKDVLHGDPASNVRRALLGGKTGNLPVS